MSSQTFLVFGATGQTGRHFVALALREGHRVRALARTPAKLTITDPRLEVREGSTEDVALLDELVAGADYVVVMLGDAARQRERNVNAAFAEQLVAAMRRHGVRRLLYQAGGLSCVPGRRLSPVLWTLRHTVARGYEGQHRDNEAVMRFLTEQAGDIEWIVHRASIRTDGPSKGVLRRSAKKLSVAPFVDCAAYNYATVMDAGAVHTSDLSAYPKG